MYFGSRALAYSVLAMVFCLPFTAASATVVARSSNQSLLPDANVVMSGSETNPVVAITPIAGASGSTTLRFDLQDGLLTVPLQLQTGGSILNLAPFVNAGNDWSVRLNQPTMLAATVLDDGLPVFPGRLTIAWSVLASDGPVILLNPGSSLTSVQFSSPGYYHFQITANDGEFISSDQVTVLVLPAETTGPEITEVRAVSVTETNAVIVWNTSRPASSQVRYGTTSSYGLASAPDPTLAIAHGVELRELVPNTEYHFQVVSRDSSGNVSVSAGMSFRTAGARFPQKFYLPVLAATGELVPPMSSGGSPADPNYQFVWSDFADEGEVILNFYVPETGTYTVWTRLYSGSEDQNGWFVSVDRGVEDLYEAAQGRPSASWQWDALSSSVGGPRRLSLSAGVHTIALRAQEPGCALNRILVTNDPDFVPQDGVPLLGLEDVAVLTNAVIETRVNPGYSVIANPLHRGGNTLGEVFFAAPEGARVFKYNPGLGQYSEFVHASGSWSDPNETLLPGEGAFFVNPTSSDIPLVFMGELRLNNSIRILARGTYLVGPMYPRGGLVTDIIDVPVRAGDGAYRFNVRSGGYDFYEFGSGMAPFELQPGEGFFLDRH